VATRLSFEALAKVRFGSMLSKKYFWGGGRNFSAPLALPMHAEVRDHIDL